jgi:hypothetical protein
MDAKDVGAHAIDVLAVSMPLHRAQGRLPSPPSGRIVIQDRLERTHARRQRVISGFRGSAAKTDRQNRGPVGSQSELGGQGDVAVGRGGVLVDQPPMVANLPPSVGDADKADGPGVELRVRQHRQMRASADSAEHLVPLVLGALTRVVRPRVDEVRGEQGEHAQPCLGGIFEANVQNDRIAARVRDHAIDHPESPAAMRARQAESGNPVFDTFDDRLAVALDLGEESFSVSDDEPEVADASLVNTWIVDLIDDAVTDGKPDPAALAERGADPVLGARGPPSRNSGPPGRFDHLVPLKAPVPDAPPASRQSTFAG